jgi:hypothetical protein
MEEKTLQILWGFLLYILSLVLVGITQPIFRSIQHLSYIQTYAFVTLGEVGSCLPLVPYAVRHWNITTWKEWIAYLYMACIAAFHIIIVIYCSHVMPFGDFAALRLSGILLAPVMAAVLDKRLLCCTTYFYICLSRSHHDPRCHCPLVPTLIALYCPLWWRAGH